MVQSLLMLGCDWVLHTIASEERNKLGGWDTSDMKKQKNYNCKSETLVAFKLCKSGLIEDDGMQIHAFLQITW